jgi:hypothetical protein
VGGTELLLRFESFVLLLLAVPACAGLTAQQRAAAAKVQVVTSEPAFNCQNLGPVSGAANGDGAGSLRANTMLQGGNTVHVDTHGNAMAFFCPEATTRVPIKVIDPP